MAEHLNTIPEVATRLRTSRSRVYELMAAGELCSLKLGRSRRIPASAVEALITRKLTESAPATRAS